jgi:hypothetical protein
MRPLVTALACLLLAATLAAQQQKREPLTEKQQDEIAEAGIHPVARVNLYIKYLNGYCETIQSLIHRAPSAARTRRIQDEIEDFSALADELGDNLDLYAQRKADIRPSLKGLNGSVAHWQQVLRGLPGEPGFDLSLKDAIASVSDLAGQAKQITADQEEYFKQHPKEKGQDRYEPQ